MAGAGTAVGERRVNEIAEALRSPSWEHAESTRPTAVARGTATHLLLDRLDLRSADEKVTMARLGIMLEDMVAREILTEAEAEAVDREGVVTFWQSEVGRRITDAASRGRLWREWSFSMAMDVADVASIWGVEVPKGQDRMVVQGTIDALWQETDGRFYLVDYKTDRPQTPMGKLVNRYRPQLILYSRSVEAVLDHTAKAYLALLSHRQVIPISCDGREKVQR